MVDPDKLAEIVAGIRVGDKPARKQSHHNKRKPTNAQACACGETWFAYTSGFWSAIVDTEDAWLLRDYKWSALGRSLDGPFYATSKRYGYETGNSAKLHQAVMKHLHGQLDHVNNNGHDCRKANLRPCTHAENMRNSRRQSNNASSKYKGVFHVGSFQWRATIRVDGKPILLGTFGFESDAAIAYNYHAAYYHGEFAKLNRVPIEEYMHD